ncbi:hypothetical protein CBS101457_000348 [Exobasidium rhododendri]|nr:hypothetical protein CBS101457_000348 [Exobasidium rhododendri]
MTTSMIVAYEELEKILANDNKVKVAGIDIDGVLRGKYMSKKKFLSAAKPGAGFGFASVIFGWDVHDLMYPEESPFCTAKEGFADLTACIDLSTYRRIPWENNLPFFLVSFFDSKDKSPLKICPRNLLKEVVDKIELQLGCSSIAGLEFEYFHFAETAQGLADKGFANLTELTPGNHGYSMLRTTMNKDYFLDLFDKAADFGIDIEGHHTETGPGVYETALAYDTVGKIADGAVLFKLLAKSIGIKYGIIPTFMAKPYSEHAGTSGHMHVSLRDSKTGKNAFAATAEELAAGGRKSAAYKDVANLSLIGEQFLAGLMLGLPDVLPILCPTINSYKRLAGGETFWAPDIHSYGYDSRVASVRILGPPDLEDYATRFEIRIPGADVNAPLALAAIFALGLYGIENKLTLPNGPVSEMEKSALPRLEKTLEAATERFTSKDSLAWKIFSKEFVEHYALTRRHEVKLFNTTVTNWERQRYLELI